MGIRSEDTIVAIATPPGVGGVGIVRLSGPRAVAIADALFRPGGGKPENRLSRVESHRMVYGWIENEEGPLDEVLAVVMRAPRSYTREDVVEVHCHGGMLILTTVLQMAVGLGARMAEAGEFTMRAFLNGRVDLTQAEAVGDIVRGRTALGLRVSADQLRGRLYEEIKALSGQVARMAALVAAGIDFPEEDVVFAHRDDIARELDGVLEKLAGLLAGAGRGRIIREGVAVAIVGRPNVGKSSLLNRLLRENRAIVTEVPGTTRDTVEEMVDMGGLMLRLVDTAGIRHTADRLELEGIARSRAAMARADLVLLVLDGAEPLGGEDWMLVEETGKQASVVAVNKMDLLEGAPPGWIAELKDRKSVLVSAVTGEGLEALEAWILDWALGGDRPVFEDALITNLRQENAAREAAGAIRTAREALEAGLGDELLAIDLERGLAALGAIVGETTADDLLNSIFAEFCIGK